MTDNEIIKALEICLEDGYDHCSKCQYYDKVQCTFELMSDALALINRLKANDDKNENVIRLADKTIEKQSKEIERLKKDKADIISAVEYRINQAKESAYKEFAEKLKRKQQEAYIQHVGYENDVVEVQEIDNLLAELTPTTLNKLPHNSLCETETYEGVTNTNVGGKKNDFKE